MSKIRHLVAAAGLSLTLLVFGALTLQSGNSQASTGYTCTQVVGGSVMGNPDNGGWYPADNFGFERIVPNANWQYIWQSGGDIEDWANLNFSGWNNPVISPCSQGSSSPDRIVLWVGKRDLYPQEDYNQWMQEAVAVVRQRFPGAALFLIPITGGPDHSLCSGNGFYASRSHVRANVAIDLVISQDPSIVKGYDSVARSCSDFRDSSGHLTDSGARDQGIKHGNWFAAYDAGATPAPSATTSPSATPSATSTPATPTSTPAASNVTRCTVRTYYANGTSYTRDVALSICQGLE